MQKRKGLYCLVICMCVLCERKREICDLSSKNGDLSMTHDDGKAINSLYSALLLFCLVSCQFNLNFSMQAIVCVSGMFDRDMSGTIDINEFQSLWHYIQQWRSTFERYDSNRSGSIEAAELHTGQFVCRCVCGHVGAC